MRLVINADLTRAEALAAYEIRCRRRRTRTDRSVAVAGSHKMDKTQSGRTFVNTNLRGTAADQPSDGGQTVAVDSVSASAGSSSTTDSLSVDISSSQSVLDVWAMQSAQIAMRPCPGPPLGSTSSNSVHRTAAVMVMEVVSGQTTDASAAGAVAAPVACTTSDSLIAGPSTTIADDGSPQSISD